VVDNLRLFQHQRDEALLAASEGLLSGSSDHLLRLLHRRIQAAGGFVSSQVEVGTGKASSGDAGIESRIAAATLGCFRSITADLLLFCQHGCH
jgi:hypothetical protein